eukprot:403358038
MNPSQLKNKFLKVVGFVSALTLASVASSSGPFAQQTMVLADFTPKLQQGRVEFYQGTMYKPNMMNLQVNQYSKTIKQKLSQDYDRRIQSLRVGPGVRAKLCKYENCADGPSSLDKTLYESQTANFIEIIGPYNAPFLIDGYSNWARHVEVTLVDTNPSTAVDPQVFVSAFNSPDLSIGAAGLFPAGEYSSTELLQRFNSSNTALDINSLIVPEGVVATLYSNEYFNGDGWVIYGPRKVNILEGLKNFQVRSIKVQNIHVVIVGKWERVTSANIGPLNTTIQRGWDQKEVKVPEDTLLKLFRTEAWKEAYSFQTEFDKTTLMTIPASVKAFDSTIKSVKQSKIIDIQANCAIKQGQDNIALYQWTYKVQIEGLDEFYVYDANYMCRYSAFAWSPPACPLNYCATSDCTTCKPQENTKISLI